MEGQNTIQMGTLDRFPPTVEDSTSMTDGHRLHTIDPDPDSDIEIFDDGREPITVGELREQESESTDLSGTGA